jgi:Copper amine oxidase N-terminal domain
MNDAPFSPRRIALSAIAIAALAFGTPAPSPAQSVTVIVGGQPLYMNPGPIERAGRVFVPLRSIFERLGASVVYQSGTINAQRSGQGVSLQIGSTQATVGGQIQYLDVAPFIIGATTYVPLRFVAQSFGAQVGYDSSTQTVSIGLPHGGGGYHPPVNPPRPLPPPNPPPVSIVRLVAQQPPPGTGVVNRFAPISAEFSNQVNAGSVRIWLDNGDITSQCNVTRGGFSFRPPAPLSFGTHTVRAAGVDSSGSRFDRSWTFSTNGAPPPVNPVALRALQPANGATVGNAFSVISAQFSRSVQPGSVRVLLDGNDITSRCGVSASAFSYKPPAPLGGGSHNVRVTGRGSDGAGFDHSWSFSVNRPAPPPRITLSIDQPSPNAVVGSAFVVKGTTVPGAQVQITAGAGAGASGQFTGSATAGPRGGFSVRVAPNFLMGQQAIRVKVRVTDPASSQSTETILQLRLNR